MSLLSQSADATRREGGVATVLQDFRYAVRTLAKSPGFVAVATITLALGISASTALFSVIYNVLIEPFPYADSQRLMTVIVHDTERSEPGGRTGFAGPELLDYTEQNRVFDGVIASSDQDVLYTSGEGTERFEGFLVTPGTFEFSECPPCMAVCCSRPTTSRARRPCSCSATRRGSAGSMGTWAS